MVSRDAIAERCPALGYRVAANHEFGKVPGQHYNWEKRQIKETRTWKKKGYVLGQSPTAARRLELQDRYFGDPSERLLDMLALRPADVVGRTGLWARQLQPIAF